MTSLVKLTVLTVAVTLAACKDKGGTGPAVLLPRAALNGDYNCTEARFFFVGPQGRGWYTSSCQGYRSVTSPSRADSVETTPISILLNNTVIRIDFSPGALQYDSTTRVLVVNYTDRPPDTFVASVDRSQLLLTQRYRAFDFSGDGETDSLLLLFPKAS